MAQSLQGLGRIVFWTNSKQPKFSNFFWNNLILTPLFQMLSSPPEFDTPPGSERSLSGDGKEASQVETEQTQKVIYHLTYTTPTSQFKSYNTSPIPQSLLPDTVGCPQRLVVPKSVFNLGLKRYLTGNRTDLGWVNFG